MQAARAAMSAAQAVSSHPDIASSAQLPAFGTGIEFRPQARREEKGAVSALAPPVPAAADRANAARVGLQLEEIDDDEGAMQVIQSPLAFDKTYLFYLSLF